MTRDGTTLLNLDDGRAFDPAVVGAKAATLARAKACRLPVLDGFAIPIIASDHAVKVGMESLETHNSGFARAAMIRAGMASDLGAAVVEAARRLGSKLVVRSSTMVEADGAWAGAFASYAELAPDEIVQGVLGCWASVFAPDPLERARAAGLTPRDVRMAVLVQPEISPSFGGVATVGDGGTVTIIGINGPPAAIVSGWERGNVVLADTTGAEPSKAVAALGSERVAAVATLARRSASEIGCGHIEWAEADGHLWLLQAQPGPPRRPDGPIAPAAESIEADPLDLLERIAEEASGRDSSGRLGMTRWEPSLFQLAAAEGSSAMGEPAAGGWGAGRVRLIRNARDAEQFEPREVVAAVYPLNNLAPLLWDAAGLITVGGSPGAHLFEVASWLGVPAVCGFDLEASSSRSLDDLVGEGELVAAVDGDAGTVSLLEVAG